MKTKECPFCNKTFKIKGITSHIQRKHEGKKIEGIGGNKVNWTDQKREEWSLKMKNRPGKKHTQDTKDKLREKALLSSHRRLLKSTRKYLTTTGETILLDSSWEEKLAKRLDFLNIKWTRPKTPIVWIDTKGNKRNYFPDFYLNDYDLYIDPKNKFAYSKQIEKINWLNNNIKNLIILTTENEIINFNIPL